MSAAEPDCAQCHLPTRARSIKKVPLFHCSACDSLTMPQASLVPLMAALREQASEESAALRTAERPPLACGGCGAEMARLDFQLKKRAYLDRCGACAMVYVPRPELEPMVQVARDSAANQDGNRAASQAQLTEQLERMSRTIMINGMHRM